MVTSKGGRRTVGEILDGLVFRLRKTSDTSDLDAQVLIAHVLDRPRSWVLAHPEKSLDIFQMNALEDAVTGLEGGNPLAYVLGVREFFGLEFEITPDVLIPRPETELLVERAITWVKGRDPGKRIVQVMDVGTGSGCIAIALAVNIPNIAITATDISPAALKVARKNAERLHVSDRITFIEADLFPKPPILDQYTLIVANLPYIPTETLRELTVYGREPTLALDGGSDGLGIIRRLLENSPERLLPGGSLMVEIEASEGPSVQELATNIFPLASIHLYKDLAGHDRLLEVQT